MADRPFDTADLLGTDATVNDFARTLHPDLPDVDRRVDEASRLGVPPEHIMREAVDDAKSNVKQTYVQQLAAIQKAYPDELARAKAEEQHKTRMGLVFQALDGLGNAIARRDPKEFLGRLEQYKQHVHEQTVGEAEKKHVQDVAGVGQLAQAESMDRASTQFGQQQEDRTDAHNPDSEMSKFVRQTVGETTGAKIPETMSAADMDKTSLAMYGSKAQRDFMAEQNRLNRENARDIAAAKATAAQGKVSPALGQRLDKWTADTKAEREKLSHVAGAIENLQSGNGITDLGAILGFVTAASGSKRFNATEVKALQDSRSMLATLQTRFGNAAVGAGSLSPYQREQLTAALRAIARETHRKIDDSTRFQSSAAHAMGVGDAFDAAVAAGARADEQSGPEQGVRLRRKSDGQIYNNVPRDRAQQLIASGEAEAAQ